MIKLCLTKQQKSSSRYKELQNEYNASSEALDHAIYSYANANEKTVSREGIDLDSIKLKDYLDGYFKIKSSNVITNKSDYETQKKAWDTINKTVFNSAEKAKLSFQKKASVFGKENVVMYSTPDGKTVVRVAEPVLKKSPSKSSSAKTINIYAGTNENADLSNFAKRPFDTTVDFDENSNMIGVSKELEGVFDAWSETMFMTVEGAFQAAKLAFTTAYNKPNSRFYSEEGIELLDRLSKASGAEARRIGKQIKGLDTKAWDAVSSKVMKVALRMSFEQNPQALQRLLSTGDATLTHTQDKGKWGTEFPRLLMEVREELRPSSSAEDMLDEALMGDTSNPVEESYNKLMEMRDSISKRVKFDEKRHIYTVYDSEEDKKNDYNGHKAIGVSKYITPKSESFGMYGTIASNIGNAVDEVTRDFFTGRLKSKYPNLTNKQLKDLVKDLEILQKHFKKIYGKNCKIITEEFPIVAAFTVMVKGKPEIRYMAGTMDMVIIDEKGKIHIYDMKAKRSGFRSDDITKYGNQQGLYRGIVESYDLDVEDTNLIHFSTYYEAPVDAKYSPGNAIYREEETNTKTSQIYVSRAGEKEVKLQNDTEYTGPRLVFNDSSEIETGSTFIPVGLDLDDERMDVQFESLSPEEKALMEEEMGTLEKKVVKTGPKETSTSVKFSGRKVVAKSGLYNPLLSASERKFLADQVMQNVSFIATQLLTDPSANERFFPDGRFKDIDFTKMTRDEIWSLGGELDNRNAPLIGHILNWIKEELINPSGNYRLSRTDLDNLPENFDIICDKLDIAYKNFSDLVNEGYSKLITLEGIPVVNAAPEEVIIDYGDESLNEANDTGMLEEKEREYWQLGQRQISAKSSLSKEIRRMFERLKVVDEDGNYIQDQFGFGLDTFVDANEAVNSILDWVKDCTTIEEMETILVEKSKYHPYLNTIIDKIQDEPIRSLFFKNFRKDFTQYSIVKVDIDKKTGKRTYSVQTINTKGATQTILQNLTTTFKSALMQNIIRTKDDVEGKGKVNIENVEAIAKKADEIIKVIHNAFGNKNKLRKVLEEQSTEITSLLNQLGINVLSRVVSASIIGDAKSANISYATSIKMLDKIKHITDTLKKNKNRTDYNPMLKEEKEGNIWSDYSSIVSLISKNIEDSIEASVYENGKMYYSFVTPSYMGKLITELKDSINDRDKFRRFIKENYSKYRWFAETLDDGNISWNNAWLQLITSNTEVQQALDHKVQLNFGKTAYDELSELGYTLSLMQEYFSYEEKGKKWAWYRLPILANKPSSEFVKFKRYSGKNYKRDIKIGLKNVFHQEILRIKTVLERAANESVNKISSYDIDLKTLKEELGDKQFKSLIKRIKTKTVTISDMVSIKKAMATKGKKSGAEFHFLDALNSEFSNPNSEISQLIVDKINGKEIKEEDLDALLIGENGGRDRGLIDDYMDQIVAREKAQWESIGLYEQIEEVKKDKEGKVTSRELKFKHLAQLGKSDEEVEAKLTEYIWNDMFATINLIQLTVTDLAYYKNMEDFQKRYAQVHSPALRLNTNAEYKGVKVSDGYSRTIYLRDAVANGKDIKSEIIPNVKAIFKKKLDSITDKTEKANMKKMMDLIISSFENDLNVTDAQGYSSPTAYRKKMVMAGQWDNTMEEAYNRIKSGNYNVNDLGVVWQPLKPFVYSQIGKASGADTMSEIKVPVQNKNSEYMLLMADALMRSEGRQSTLGAIFDFMENSAYDGRVVKDGKVIEEGTYNGHGIDTVQFESAVKSGLMGVIDINGLDYDQIQKKLNKAVYYNEDKSASTDNNMDIYNDQFVHSIPFEDYGIQQEVPAHMKDHMQAMGSQVRILSVSDISPEARFKVHNYKGQADGKVDRDYLVSRYQELIAANIRESYDKLAKELKLNSKDRKVRNKALSDILVDAIKKDQRYGADLLRACQIDKETGEFVIPPCDPIQSQRIQQLVNSIIKSRINKQKVQGGPVVQTSIFGFSDDLHIVFNDKNGNPLRFKRENETDEEYEKYVLENQGSLAYMEVYMPIPSQELEDALTKPDGTIMDVEEALRKKIITEEMLKAIGYRIPTEDKYSMIPMRIKGFVPKAAGEALMMPKEITLLTGSDFDIDKIYIMLKEFKPVDVTDIGKVKKIIIDAYKKQFGNLSKQDYDFIDYVISELYNGREVEDKNASPEKLKIIRRIKGAYNKIAPKYTKKTFKERTAKDEETQNTSTRNNEIFDIQWAVLTNEDTMSKMFNPGSFDVQKKSARIIKALKAGVNKTYEQLSAISLKELDSLVSSTTGNIIFSTTQVAFHKQNMTAGKLIGIFANNNTSHAFLSMKHIHLNMESDDSFTIGGYTVSSSENNQLDRQKAFDGSLISKNIAGFLAASVDAVKDPVLNFMNLNTFTAGPAMVLARLGFDSDSIGLLMTQPIIEKVSREYFRQNNDGYTSVEDIIKGELNSSAYKDRWEAMEENIAAMDFSKEDLAKAIAENNDSTEFQIMSLLLFKKLAGISTNLNTLTFLTKFNSVTNAVGPTIADTIVMRERVNKFMDLMQSDNPPFSDNAMHILDEDDGKDTILHAFYDTTVGDKGIARAIFEPYFPHYSPAVTSLISLMRKTTKAQLDSKIINKLVNDYLFYKLTVGKNPIINTDEEERIRFINHFPAEFRERAAGIVDNELINIITTESSSAKCPVPTLQAKTGGYSADVQERIKAAWSTLMENPDTFELGRDLFFYNLYRSGFTFSPKTFLHLASVDTKLAIGDYVDALANTEFNDRDVNLEEFLLQFRRNHSMNNRVVPTLVDHPKLRIDKNTKEKDKEKDKDKDTDKKPTITITFDRKRKTGLESIITESKSTFVTLAPVIWYDDKLWYAYNSEVRGNSITYTLTSPLGINNDFLEYNANEDSSSMKTAVGKKVTQMEEEDEGPASRSDEPVNHNKSEITDNEIDFLFNGEGPLAKYREEVFGVSKTKGEDAATDRTLDLIEKFVATTNKKKVKEKLIEILKRFCRG